MLETIWLSEETIDLPSESMIVFYTDGITEARAEGEEFGEERLLALLNHVDRLSAREIADSVARAVQEYADKLSDDIVVLVAQRTDQQSS